MEDEHVMRAYKIIKLYAELPEGNEDLRATFESWLLSPMGAEYKDKALFKYFNEIMDGKSGETGWNEKTTAAYEKMMNEIAPKKKIANN